MAQDTLQHVGSGVKAPLRIEGNGLVLGGTGVEWPIDELDSVSALRLSDTKGALLVAPHGEDFEEFVGRWDIVWPLACELWEAIPDPADGEVWWRQLPRDFQIPLGASQLLGTPRGPIQRPPRVMATVVPAGVTLSTGGWPRANIRWEYLTNVFVGGVDEYRYRFPDMGYFVLFGVFAFLGTRKEGRSVLVLETSVGPWVVGVSLMPTQLRTTLWPVVEQYEDSASDAGASEPVSDVPARLRQLADLRDEGLITIEDFESKKAELLRRI